MGGFERSFVILSVLWYSICMIEADKNKIAEIAKNHGLGLIVLFGSQATGHTHKKSDVDVGFLSRREIDYRESYDITVELARIFKNPDVEFVNMRNISPELKKQVADQGIVLFEENSSMFDIFSMHANRLYMETKPLRAYRESYVNNFLKSYVQ